MLIHRITIGHRGGPEATLRAVRPFPPRALKLHLDRARTHHPSVVAREAREPTPIPPNGRVVDTPGRHANTRSQIKSPRI